MDTPTAGGIFIVILLLIASFFWDPLKLAVALGDRLQRKYKLRTDHYAASVAIAILLILVVVPMTLMLLSRYLE